MKPTRCDLEAQIKSIADECPFTMPFWLAGMLVGELRRQNLTSVRYDGEDFRVTVKIKQSPMKRLGAAGEQMQGGRTLPASDGSGLRCVRFQCDEADLVWLEVGQSRQTYNGFLVAKIAGWYCPKCAGSYGP